MLELKKSWGEGMSFINVEPRQPDSEGGAARGGGV
jgi:hypothetical protein